MAGVLNEITRIEDVFSGWRELGSKRLANGTELIGRQAAAEGDVWMHAVFPRLDTATIGQIEHELGVRLPVDLRTFYRTCGGMILFGGAFRLFGTRPRRGSVNELGPVPDDITSINEDLSLSPWMRPGAIAFASNAWDSSLHVTGMGATATEVLRVHRITGEVLERSENIWSLVASKLYRLDEIFVR